MFKRLLVAIMSLVFRKKKPDRNKEDLYPLW